MIPLGPIVDIDKGVLRGPAGKVYGMLSGDNERTKASPKPWNSNSMRQMRAAFGLSLNADAIADWLNYWDTLTAEQRIQLRRMDLSTLPESDFPRPPKTTAEGVS